MSKEIYVVNCYTCQHNGQETCKGCNTLLNGDVEPYENWELREDLSQKDQRIAELEQELAELKSKYEDCENERLQNRMDYLTMKNKWLNSEKKLAELKEKAIVPPVKIGDTIYDVLEKQDSENVASRIDYLTGKDYSEMCELYKTAKNLKQHDRELVKEVCDKIKEQLGFIVDGQERIVCDGSATGDKTILAVLNQIQKEFEK